MSNSGSTTPTMNYRKLRAPQNSGQILLDPPACELAEAVANNRTAWDQCTTPILGVPLHRLAIAAREHLLDAAFEYTTTYRQVSFSRDSVEAETQLILSGHQPQLFHPGVWFKNFALHAIAKSRQAVGINLIIDNDLALGASVRVPGGSVDQPQTTTVTYDQAQAAVPYEAREIADLDFFATFPQRVRDVASFSGSQRSESGQSSESSDKNHGEKDDSILEPLWKHAIEATQRSDNLGLCLSQARHLLEADAGLETLEVPLSRVCDHASFLHFAAHLLQAPQDLREQYNAAIEEYRAVHGLRSQSHPAPLLECVKDGDGASDGDWFEAPFWIWSADNATRDRLFVRKSNDPGDKGDGSIEVCRGLPSTDAANNIKLTLPVDTSSDSTLATGAKWLAALTERGLRFRPRALITTLFARVCLSDLFLHGIGGSKYDQVTDRLIESLLGMTAPTYATVTATLHLPIERERVDADELRQLNGMLRELTYHPETMLVDDTSDDLGKFAAQLRKKKKKILAKIPPRGQRKAWNDDLQRINTQLHEHVRPLRSILQQRRIEVIQRLRGEVILGSREFAFCLFPKAFLGQNLLDMARVVS